MMGGCGSTLNSCTPTRIRGSGTFTRGLPGRRMSRIMTSSSRKLYSVRPVRSRERPTAAPWLSALTNAVATSSTHTGRNG